jgi:hypothetical protein
MKYIRPTHVALALLAGTLVADPANACCGGGGPAMQPAGPPVSSGGSIPRGPTNIVVPRGPEFKPSPGSVGASPTTSPPAKPPPKVLSATDYANKMDEMSKAAERQNKEKNLNLTPEQIAERVLKAMNDNYKMQTWKETEEEERLRRETSLAKQKADWQARDAEKAKEEAEAAKQREAQNRPVDWQEKIRQNRVNSGKEPPRPGDEKQPWYSPNYEPGEKPWLIPTK